MVATLVALMAEKLVVVKVATMVAMMDALRAEKTELRQAALWVETMAHMLAGMMAEMMAVLKA
jgi:hypothetical protein